MKSPLMPILIGALSLSSVAVGQQVARATSSPLLASLTAMQGQSTIQDVTLNGTAEVIAGSSDDTASAVLEALSGGSTSVTLSLPSGTSSDIKLIGAFVPSGTWSKGDGVKHTISQHNMMTDAAWFFPDLVVSRMISNTALTVVYVGQTGTLLHFQAYQRQLNASAVSGPLIQHLTQIDLYLNSTTLLPASLQFNIHPDQNASVDIPVTIQYSNYQTVGGISLPFHVQRYINNSLALDLQIQSATFNSGITAAALSAQQ